MNKSILPQILAAENMDWQGVVLNGGPSCFHLEGDGHFCGRAARWPGHLEAFRDNGGHKFVSLADLLRSISEPSLNPIGPSSDDYSAWMATRPDMKDRLKPSSINFTTHAGYEIWRNAWLACEREHGIRRDKPDTP